MATTWDPLLACEVLTSLQTRAGRKLTRKGGRLDIRVRCTIVLGATIVRQRLEGFIFVLVGTGLRDRNSLLVNIPFRLLLHRVGPYLSDFLIDGAAREGTGSRTIGMPC